MQRKTKQRDTVFMVLHSVKTHPTASWIYDNARKIIPNISLGTVYRNLAELKKNGDIIAFDAGSGIEHFDSNALPHYHFCCKKCNNVSDLHMPCLTEIEDAAASELNCSIESHSLIFYGLCKKCK